MKKQVKLTGNKKQLNNVEKTTSAAFLKKQVSRRQVARISINKLSTNYKITLLFGEKSKVVL